MKRAMVMYCLAGCYLYCVLQLILFSGILAASSAPLIFLISFDGFRWDYLDVVKNEGYETPNFNSLIKTGSKAKWMKNSYATVTFPNHYSIATGLNEENHGVINNKMYDPVFNEEFTGKNGQMQESKWWNNGSDGWKGEPIWLTNQQKEGQRSGVYDWIGSEAAIKGQHPYHYTKYNWSMPYKDRVDTVIGWMIDSQQPINLAMLYFDEPDTTGHDKGPDSKDMVDKIVELDELLGYIIDSLKNHNLLDRTDLIVTSDHGMAQMNETIYFNDYVNTSLFTAYGETPVWHIVPNKGKEDEVYQQLQNVPHVYVYKKKDIPKEYHYRWNRRVQAIIVEAYIGTVVCLNVSKCPKYKGDHGFNNSISSMHPIFIANGPSFKQGYVSEPFHNVDIYPLLCSLLGVTPAQHDGDLARIQHLLNDRDNIHPTLYTAFGVVIGVFLLFVLVFVMLQCSSCTVETIRQRYSQYSRVSQNYEQSALLNSDGTA